MRRGRRSFHPYSLATQTNMMCKRVTTLATFLVLLFAGSAWAQTEVTVRELNAVSEDNINELIQKGADLTQ